MHGVTMERRKVNNEDANMVKAVNVKLYYLDLFASASKVKNLFISYNYSP